MPFGANPHIINMCRHAYLYKDTLRCFARTINSVTSANTVVYTTQPIHSVTADADGNDSASASSSSAVATTSPEAGETVDRTLLRARKCWLCKAEYKQVHHFYDQFCPGCASFNCAVLSLF
jgi:hypothetical protein